LFRPAARAQVRAIVHSRTTIHVSQTIHVNVNDGSFVKIWQDERVTKRSATADSGVNPAAQIRTISTAAELKALADPLRLAILTALMKDAPRELRVLSVKELAAELGEPKTKLYRHIKQLEAAGLIRVAATRLVSGIVEQRYQASQGDLHIGRGVTRDPAMADDSITAVSLLVEQYFDRYLAHVKQAQAAGFAPREPYREATMRLVSTTASPARAKAAVDRLKEVIDELAEDDDSDDAVTVEILVAYMSPD
jgi:DNA-binding transcriptional ArsR family regulator